MRRLILMRHAKAVRPHLVPTDFERGLAERGRIEAGRTGALLIAAGHTPDRALVSTARRAVETWEAMGLDARVGEVRFLDALYMASPADTQALARAEGGEGSVLVIAHNPGLHALALAFASGPGPHDAAGRARLEDGFPTAWAAAFEVDEALNERGARLTALFAPERADSPA